MVQLHWEKLHGIFERYTSFPAILRASKRCHAEAQKIMYEVNEVEVKLFSSISFGYSPCESYHGSVAIYINSCCFVRGDFEQKRILDMVESWPEFLQKVQKIRLTIKACDKRKRPEDRYLLYEGIEPKAMFAPLATRILSLAYVATSCKELLVTFQYHNRVERRTAVLRVDRLLASAAAFANVSKCEVMMQGSTTAGESLRAVILGPVPESLESKHILRVFNLMAEAQYALSLAPITSFAWAAGSPYELTRCKIQELLARTESFVLNSYPPYVDGKGTLSDYSVRLEEFLMLPQTQRLIGEKRMESRVDALSRN